MNFTSQDSQKENFAWYPPLTNWLSETNVALEKKGFKSYQQSLNLLFIPGTDGITNSSHAATSAAVIVCLSAGTSTVVLAWELKILFLSSE